MEEIILASKSPRRIEILKKFEIPFKSIPPLVDEVTNNDPPIVQARRISKEKTDAIVKKYIEFSTKIVVGMDTCIDLDGAMTGKPKDMDEAGEILKKLSGRTHKVITGITIYIGHDKRYIQKEEVSEVTFATLSNSEISWYLSTNEWKGAAGGYRIQDKGALLIESINGSYYNIMGLPIRMFYGMLSPYVPWS